MEDNARRISDELRVSAGHSPMPRTELVVPVSANQASIVSVTARRLSCFSLGMAQIRHISGHKKYRSLKW